MNKDKSPQSIGGQIMAKRQRDAALENYYSNPIRCKCCDKIIEVKENQKVSEVRKKKFCDRTCSAKVNSIGRECKFKKDIGECQRCCNTINYKYNSVAKTYYKRKYCSSCLIDIKKEKSVRTSTKKETFDKCKNWQSARSTIQKDARNHYREHGSMSCKRCGYKKHIEICHIKSVSSFEEHILIEEINDLKNLIGLCPNCHWEFDHGMLDLEHIAGQSNLVTRQTHNLETSLEACGGSNPPPATKIKLPMQHNDIAPVL